MWWHESVIITPCHLILDRYEFLGAPATFANLKYFTKKGQRSDCDWKKVMAIRLPSFAGDWTAMCDGRSLDTTSSISLIFESDFDGSRRHFLTSRPVATRYFVFRD